MKKQAIALITGIIILACIIGVGAYILTQPQYKTITMSGITLEVPDTNATVQENSPNYNTYNDQENNLTIKTWSIRDMNDWNGSIQAGWDIGVQHGSNIGSNTTYNNISVYNKSGTYTYYEQDTTKNCMIIITGTNIEQVTHAVKTINKTGVYTGNTNLTVNNITNQTNNTNNTTISTDASSSQSTPQATSNTKKKSTGSSSHTDYTDTDDYKKGYIDKNGYTTGKGQFQEAGLSPREQQKILKEIGDS